MDRPSEIKNETDLLLKLEEDFALVYASQEDKQYFRDKLSQIIRQRGFPAVMRGIDESVIAGLRLLDYINEAAEQWEAHWLEPERDRLITVAQIFASFCEVPKEKPLRECSETELRILVNYIREVLREKPFIFCKNLLIAAAEGRLRMLIRGQPGSA